MSTTPPATPAATSVITATERAQVEAANASGRQPVVFVHGLWLLPSSWDAWREHFESLGYATLAPGWPDDPETVEEARAHPEVFAGKTVGQVTDHVADVIRLLDREPVVIGHSFGGLITQKLAGQGLARASVAVDPAPFRGVLPLPVSALRASSPVLINPANYNRHVSLTFDQYRYAFANAVSAEEAADLYRTYPVAAPGRPLFQAATANLNPRTEASVDTGQPRPRPAPRHQRREGPHRAVGHRARLLQASAEEPRPHRDHRDPGAWALARRRQRLARGRRRCRRLPRPPRRRARRSPGSSPGSSTRRSPLTPEAPRGQPIR